jgi:hypothetical protein
MTLDAPRDMSALISTRTNVSEASHQCPACVSKLPFVLSLWNYRPGVSDIFGASRVSRQHLLNMGLRVQANLLKSWRALPRVPISLSRGTQLNQACARHSTENPSQLRLVQSRSPVCLPGADRGFRIYVSFGSQKSALPCFDSRHCAIEVKAHSCDESVIRHQA